MSPAWVWSWWKKEFRRDKIIKTGLERTQAEWSESAVRCRCSERLRQARFPVKTFTLCYSVTCFNRVCFMWRAGDNKWFHTWLSHPFFLIKNNATFKLLFSFMKTTIKTVSLRGSGRIKVGFVWFSFFYSVKCKVEPADITRALFSSNHSFNFHSSSRLHILSIFLHPRLGSSASGHRITATTWQTPRLSFLQIKNRFLCFVCVFGSDSASVIQT